MRFVVIESVSNEGDWGRLEESEWGRLEER